VQRELERSEPIACERPEPVARPEPMPRSEPVPRSQPERPSQIEPISRTMSVESARASLRAASVAQRPLSAAPAAAPASDDHPDPTSEVGDRSEPETYDRLVDAFLNTESELIRRRIATRLHSSRNSDHPLARFYANRAIERLVDAGEEEALENVMSQLGAE